MFYAIATLIDEENWNYILNQIPEGKKLVSDGKIETRFPHFSWMVAQTIDTEKIKRSLLKISKNSQEFTISTGGFGIFPGREPVITINLVRDKELNKLHQQLWKECYPAMQLINQKYAPDAWIPHITLLHHNIQIDDCCQFLRNTLNRDLFFELPVDNFCILFRNETESGLIANYEFNG